MNAIPERYHKRNIPDDPYNMPNPLPVEARVRVPPRVPAATPYAAPGGVLPAPGFNAIPGATLHAATTPVSPGLNPIPVVPVQNNHIDIDE